MIDRLIIKDKNYHILSFDLESCKTYTNYIPKLVCDILKIQQLIIDCDGRVSDESINVNNIKYKKINFKNSEDIMKFKILL